jgi:hypothetical protein
MLGQGAGKVTSTEAVPYLTRPSIICRGWPRRSDSPPSIAPANLLPGAHLPPSRPHYLCALMVFRPRSLRPATQIEFLKFSSPIQRAWGVTKRYPRPPPMHRRCLATIHLSPPGQHRLPHRRHLPVGRSSRRKAPFSLRGTKPGTRNEATPAKSCAGRPSAAMAYCRR